MSAPSSSLTGCTRTEVRYDTAFAMQNRIFNILCIGKNRLPTYPVSSLWTLHTSQTFMQSCKAAFWFCGGARAHVRPIAAPKCSPSQVVCLCWNVCIIAIRLSTNVCFAFACVTVTSFQRVRHKKRVGEKQRHPKEERAQRRRRRGGKVKWEVRPPIFVWCCFSALFPSGWCCLGW